MAKKSETLEMADLYRKGKTLRQIADRYKISWQAVQQRLHRIGLSSVVRPTRISKVDRTRLEDLYARGIPLYKIARELGVSQITLKEALAFYEIPKRKWIYKKGKRVDFLRQLQVGDEFAEQFCGESTRITIYKAACRVGIKVKTLRDGDHLKVTRIA